MSYPRQTIITRTPYRLSITGATDLWPYVERYGGTGFAATINKFATIIISRRDDERIVLRYPSGEEDVRDVEDIEHSIIRQALKNHGIVSSVEIISLTDIPPGSGLGSSGAFTVGLLNGLHALQGQTLSPLELAEEACELEINQLKNPIGKYDQYLAAIGGFVHLRFKRDGSVGVKRHRLDPKTIDHFHDHIFLVYSGIRRSASDLLSKTMHKIQTASDLYKNMTEFKRLGACIHRCIIEGRISEFPGHVRRLADCKRECYIASTNEAIDRFVAYGYKHGAAVAKIMGAGGGGFVYFYVPKENQAKFIDGITKSGGTIFPFRFIDYGSQIIS